MNDYQNAKVKTYVLMGDVADSYPAVVALVPRMQGAFVRMRSISNEIISISSQQSADLTGVTTDKNMDMKELNDSMVDVAGAVYSYAGLQNDPTTQAKVNFKEWKIDRMTQPQLMDAAGVVLAEATKIAPEDLTQEGISPAEMTAFRAAYTTYTDVRFDPRNATIDHKELTDRLAELFTEAYNLKKHTLDRLIVQFKRKSPEFYNKYLSASMIIYQHNSTPEADEVTPPAV